jgi:hypothetical protein
MICNVYYILCIFMCIWDVNDQLMVRNSQPQKLDSRSRGNSTGQTSSTSKNVTNLQRAITVVQGLYQALILRSRSLGWGKNGRAWALIGPYAG